jgi:hypothetical protein
MGAGDAVQEQPAVDVVELVLQRDRFVTISLDDP